MDSNIDVQIISEKDVEVLQSLRLKLVHENPHVFGETSETESKNNLDYYRKWLKKYSTKNAAMFILFVNGEAAGMCAVKKDKKSQTGYFGSLGVLRKYQGKGYGRFLLEHREKWVSENTDFKLIKTIITKENLKMLGIAQKMGFSIVGEGEYKGVPEFYLEKIL